ncbi:MAG TPA: hypothetical protein VK774_02400 [Solirubrobacteraceae bacterium]|jgi:hypothetical protein|nr:hypothetical protein [Solirubrobacteraceae bacterium]
MNGTGYKLLGLAVWRGGKWYLRKRLPSRRKLVIASAGGLSALSAAAVLARRASA